MPEDGKSKFGFLKLELQQRSEVFFRVILSWALRSNVFANFEFYSE